MGAAILSELGTEILVPACAVVGIAFALVQWVLVSQVKLSPGKGTDGDKNGYTEALIEEEEGINEHSIIHKCAEIQNAISEGEVCLFVAPLGIQLRSCGLGGLW